GGELTGERCFHPTRRVEDAVLVYQNVILDAASWMETTFAGQLTSLRASNTTVYDVDERKPVAHLGGKTNNEIFDYFLNGALRLEVPDPEMQTLALGPAGSNEFQVR